MTDHADAFIATMDLRVREILDRCTRCAKCVEVCPTAVPAGIDISEPAAIVGDVLDILRGGGDPSSRGARWANACTGSGRCISACDDGINPRFMLAATRLASYKNVLNRIFAALIFVVAGYVLYRSIGAFTLG